jgi:phosphopantothenoylcysteine decarboxylase/phosphopantothenate--cysteine ligase
VAGYKAAYLARRLVEAGAEVRTVMTDSATRFLGAQTLAAITGTAPVVGLFGAEDVSPHTTLARWADAVVVAPATAATLSRIAVGLAEDALSTTVLAAWGKPVVLAPAMHTEMWEHPATRRTVATLASDGYHLVGPETGALAGGDEGPGRMAEPEVIVAALERVLGGGDLAGWRVLVSAGGTREAIDPVRFIGNASSGKQGVALARSAVARGADVVLVGANLAQAPTGVGTFVPVVSTAALRDAVRAAAQEADAVVMAAAVADFRPVHVPDAKIKKVAGEAPAPIELVENPDILRELATERLRPGQVVVGFAAETGDAAGDVLFHGRAKARRKGADLVVVNAVGVGKTFGTDENDVTIVDAAGEVVETAAGTKEHVADVVWDAVVKRFTRSPAFG